MKKVLFIILLSGIVGIVSAAPGSLVWRYKTGNNIDHSAPVIKNKILYIGSTDNYLYTLNASDGSLKWRYSSGAGIKVTPLVGASNLYYGSIDRYFYKLMTSGSQSWKRQVDDEISYSSACFHSGGDSVLFFGSRDHYLYSLRSTNASLRFKFNSGGYIFSLPVAYTSSNNFLLVFGSDDHNVYYIGQNSGSIYWKYTTGGVFINDPVLANGRIYIGSADHKMYCFNANANGGKVWEFEAGDIIFSSPAVSDNRVYFGCNDKYLRCLNATSGSVFWLYETGDVIYSKPLVRTGTVFFGSNDYYFYALNSTTGTLKWNYRSGSCTSGSTIWDGMVFFGSFDDYINAIQAGDMTVTAPNGGEVWACNTNKTITWKAEYCDSVKLYYSYDGGGNWRYITTTVNDGSYTWKIPWMDKIDRARIRVTNMSGNIRDGSDANFTIDPGSIIVNSPNGGETWRIGSQHYITKTYSTNIDSLTYWYSTNNGATWRLITKGKAYTSSYSWFIPNTPSEQCLVRIENTNFTSQRDQSNAVFTISADGFNDAYSSKALPAAFSASPNPFTYKLEASMTTKGAIYSLTGNLITSLDKGRHELNTSSWKPGIYIIQSGNETKRIVKIE